MLCVGLFHVFVAGVNYINTTVEILFSLSTRVCMALSQFVILNSSCCYSEIQNPKAVFLHVSCFCDVILQHR